MEFGELLWVELSVLSPEDSGLALTAANSRYGCCLRSVPMPLGSKIISLGGTDPSDDVIGKKSCVLVFLLLFCSFTYFFGGGTTYLPNESYSEA